MSIKHTKALMGSLGQLSPKGFDLFFLEDPIHIASVLVQLIFRPEKSLNDTPTDYMKRWGGVIIS